jgi:hypothetical protein
MKMYGGVDVQIHLILAPAGSKWSALCPGRFTPKERSPSVNWLEGCVGPRAGLHDVDRKFYPLQWLFH